MEKVYILSYYHFLASDQKLTEIINPRVETISINEALRRNASVADFLLDDETIDRDEKILLFSEDKEALDELEITKDLYFPKDYASSYSDKKYFSEIHGRYSDSRVKELHAYLVLEMKDTAEIEVWRVEADEYETPEVWTVTLEDFEAKDLAFLNYKNARNKTICLVIHK